MRILITHDSTNRVVDGEEVHDASGAFIPQSVVAQRVRTAKGDEVQRVACNTVAETLAAIEAAGTIDAWWYLGHGTHYGLPSIKATMRDVGRLTAALAKHANAGAMRVALFACSTGGTPGGFAASMRTQLEANGITRGWVDSHSTAAHTTENPYVVRFAMKDEQPDELPVVNIEALWPTWRDALLDDADFRFAWPLQSWRETRVQLAAKAAASTPVA